MYTVKEVAAMFNINAETVRRWIRNGEIEAGVSGKDYTISEEALRDFASSHPKYKIEKEEKPVQPEDIQLQILNELKVLNGALEIILKGKK